jgi:hypothetical protein
MSENLPPIVSDERAGARKRVLRGGKIVYGEAGEFSLDCLIHDVSDTGARISLKPNEFIPTSFYLIDAQRGLAYEAAASWIRVIKSVPQFGLKFTRTHELQNLTNRKLHFLKRFAVPASLRQER